MFIKKDNRKVLEIIYSEDSDLTQLKLARREAEFAAGTDLLLSPQHSAQLATTRHLTLYNNKLTKLTNVRSIAKHNTLESLDLGLNSLTELPNSFGDLGATLKSLWVENNLLGREFPSPILKCHQLTVLRLSCNRIEVMPDSIKSLKNLEELAIDGNLLTQLPSSIGELTQMRKLNLRGNKLTSIPEEIGNLDKLELLSVNDNQLESLPSSIWKLSSLSSLYANSNKLITLPAGLAKLEKLKKVNAANNDIKFLPLALIDRWALHLDIDIIRSAPIRIKSFLSTITTTIADDESAVVGNDNRVRKEDVDLGPWEELNKGKSVPPEYIPSGTIIKPLGSGVFSLNIIETPLFKNGEEGNSALMAIKYAPPLIDELRRNMQTKADKKAGTAKAGRVKHQVEEHDDVGGEL